MAELNVLSTNLIQLIQPDVFDMFFFLSWLRTRICITDNVFSFVNFNEVFLSASAPSAFLDIVFFPSASYVYWSSNQNIQLWIELYTCNRRVLFFIILFIFNLSALRLTKNIHHLIWTITHFIVYYTMQLWVIVQCEL